MPVNRYEIGKEPGCGEFDTTGPPSATPVKLTRDIFKKPMGDDMEEEQAIAVARALGGDVWQSGGDIWLVIIRRADGHVVVLSDEAVCEYSNEESMGTEQPLSNIVLC